MNLHEYQLSLIEKIERSTADEGLGHFVFVVTVKKFLKMFQKGYMLMLKIVLKYILNFITTSNKDVCCSRLFCYNKRLQKEYHT